MSSRILVVNQSAEVLQNYEQVLLEAGYEVILQIYKPDITDYIRVARPDLLILDYPLSDGDLGWFTLQMVKMSADIAATPQLICVAPSVIVEEMRPQLRRKGITVLLKPFTPAELLTAVSSALGPASASGNPLPQTNNHPPSQFLSPFFLLAQ